MDLATGAMSSLLPKLVELLKEEYKLQKGVREGVKSLEKEMKSMHAALCLVAEVPRDKLDKQVKLWAGEVRELSFDMEDVVDKFLVRVDDDSEPATKSNKLKRLTEKMAGLFTKGKARHEIADAIKDINKQVQEVADRRARYNIDNIVGRHAPVTTIDPRLKALYTEVTKLVGIAGKTDQELMKLLLEKDSMSEKKLKIVSVVGFGGLGKTTLVKTVYDKIKGDFDCRAFVPVGQNVVAKKVLMDILIGLDKCESHFTMFNEQQLINKLREILENKRYLIVIDDIWDEELWETINLAFSSSNNYGSRLITTTRIVSVSKFCCQSTDDSVYEMKPLSDDDSKRLFYNRIFSHDSECPSEFEKVSVDILKKCGGVPLAIVTIASLLASYQGVKPVDEWHSLLKSIGHGLTEDPSVDEMLRILSLSYYDLPSHLKTCLLYLSMFPEDSEIDKDRLIWMWIAESFVQCGNGRSSLFEVGETYFNELVNRNMIQPVYEDDDDSNTGVVLACRVHDMVLDLISSLSREDNFVTICNGIGDSISSGGKARRMSLQYFRKEEHQTTPFESVSMSQVRSIAAFKPAIDLVPPFSSFGVLRVLDLTRCHLGHHHHLNLLDLGSLFHLRYLGLAQTGIDKLPEELGKLQFLEVLDVSGNYDMTLPLTVIKLRRLMCLLISETVPFPDGFGNLTSMEVLDRIFCESLSTLKELSNMVRLRRLCIEFRHLSVELEEALVVSLGKLSNIQRLEISTEEKHVIVLADLIGERWVPPRSLQRFCTNDSIRFSTLPACIKGNPSRLSQLYWLDIYVEEVQQQDLESLGRLPALGHLYLQCTKRSGPLRVGADGFRSVTVFWLYSDCPDQIVFRPGALPKAVEVRVDVGLRIAEEDAAAGNGGDCPYLGMATMPCLQVVIVTFYRFAGTSLMDAKQAEASLENALRANPSSPTFYISFEPGLSVEVNDDDSSSKVDHSE